MAPRKRTFIDFRAHNPLTSIGQREGALGTTTQVQALGFGPHSLEMYIEETNADQAPTRVVDANCTNGFLPPLDNGDGDGIELTQGILSDANAPYAFTIGTDPAFKFDLKLGIPVVADMSIMVGFRTASSYVADVANATAATALTNAATAYPDKACFVIHTGDMHIYTSNDNSDVATDISAAWTDDQVKLLSVRVDSAGAVTYYIDGTAVADAVAFSFDSTDVVIPFVRISRVATGEDHGPILNYWFCGYQ
jgi:hypothetical protein